MLCYEKVEMENKVVINFIWCKVCRKQPMLKGQTLESALTMAHGTWAKKISNSMKFCDSFPKFEVVTEASKCSFNSENEPDHNLPMCTSCNYYSTNEVRNLKTL